jgi:hypothetical protein
MVFVPGASGNPNGKKRGTKNKSTMAAEALLAGEAQGLTRKCIEMALSGDASAMRLCIERIMPLRKGRPVRFPMPQVDQPSDLVGALAAVIGAVSEGALTPDEGGHLAALLNTQAKAIELTQVIERLRELERRVTDVATRNR